MSPPDTFHVALVEPEIPGNTGNISRLCAGLRVPLHIVGEPGFRMDDAAVRRAGLDYWPHVDLHRHAGMPELSDALPRSRLLYLTTKARRPYTDLKFHPGDCLVFGRETRGLPDDLLQAHPERCFAIPMFHPAVRSLNLSNAVAVVVHEALRQTGAFAGWERADGLG